MMDKNQLKAEGILFGKSLQRAYRIALLYTADHASAQEPLEQAHANLSAILKQSPQFTFGFYNQRVLLNDLLTQENALAGLQAEFFKRSIAAVCFFLGITLREFKRGLSILAAKPEAIEQSGGITAYLKKNPVEGMRILAEEKRINPEGDTVLGMDLQSYLMTQAVLETPGARPVSLEMLLQTAGMGSPATFQGTAEEVMELAGKATQAAWADPDANPKEVVHALARLFEELTPEYLISALPADRQERYRGRPAQEIATEVAEDMALEWAANRLTTAGEGSGSGEGGGAGGGAGTGTGGGPGGSGGPLEQEVVAVLARTLRTTQVAERLLRKLGDLIQQSKLPEEVGERIRQELMWASLSLGEKRTRLLALKQFTDQEFGHLIQYVEETGRGGDVEGATEVAEHYLSMLEKAPEEARAGGLGHLPQLLHALTSFHTLAFVRNVAGRLCGQLTEEQPSEGQSHREVANALASAAQNAALFEDFETAMKIGLELERCQARDPGGHAECCGKALENLLPAASIERLVEMSLQKKMDPGVSRMVSVLLRQVGVHGAEVLLQLLEAETSATNRTRLLRVASQLGPSAVEAARKRLQDDRWYVVRNACNLLGALADPDLAAMLEPALQHPDDRVQQAAVTTLIKSKVPRRSEALAKALPDLHPHLQEMVLNDLSLARDRTAIEGITEFISKGGGKTAILDKAAQALGAIPDERAAEALGKILCDPRQPLSLRRTALAALKNPSLPGAGQWLAALSSLAPDDPLAEEYRKAVSRP